MKKIEPYLGLIIAILFIIFGVIWSTKYYEPTISGYNKEQNRLLNKISKIRNSLDSVSNLRTVELHSLKQKLSNLERQLQEGINQEDWQTIEGQVAEDLRGIIGFIDHPDAFRHTVFPSPSPNNTTVQQLAVVNSENEQLKKEKQKLEDKITKLSNQVNYQASKISAKNAEIEYLKELSVQNNTSQLFEKINQLKQEKSDLEQTRIGLQNNLNDLQEKYEKDAKIWQGQIDSLQGIIQSFQNQDGNGGNNNNSELQQQIADLQNALTEQKNSLNAYQNFFRTHSFKTGVFVNSKGHEHSFYTKDGAAPKVSPKIYQRIRLKVITIAQKEKVSITMVNSKSQLSIHNGSSSIQITKNTDIGTIQYEALFSQKLKKGTYEVIVKGVSTGKLYFKSSFIAAQ